MRFGDVRCFERRGSRPKFALDYRACIAQGRHNPSKVSPDIQRFTALVPGAGGVCLQLQGGQVGVEVGDGLDSAEIVFQGDVLVGSVCIFVG